MSPELDEKLCKKFPKIFKHRHSDMRGTCMCWGFEHGNGWYDIIYALCSLIQSHIDHSRENRLWYLQQKRAVERAIKHNTLKEYVENCFKTYHPDVKQGYIDEALADPSSLYPKEEVVAVPQVVAQQVKEKFGTLRFYYYGGDDYVRGVEAFADYLSACTCESCGAKGTTGGTGWIQTLCEACRSKKK